MIMASKCAYLEVVELGSGNVVEGVDGMLELSFHAFGQVSEMSSGIADRFLSFVLGTDDESETLASDLLEFRGLRSDLSRTEDERKKED